MPSKPPNGRLVGFWIEGAKWFPKTGPLVDWD
jgi:hypothetical protein